MRAWVLLAFLPVFSFGQFAPGKVLGRIDDGGISGDVVYVENDSWSETMQKSFIAINSPYVTYTQAEKDTILLRLSTGYIISTFGPAGQNKTTCDFFMIFWNSNTSTALTTKTNIKTGETLRWNYGGGHIYSQNNLPGQVTTGIITLTSIDGWNGINTFDLSQNNFISNMCYFNFPNIQFLYIQKNSFTADISKWGEIDMWDNIRYFVINENLFTGYSGSLNSWDKIEYFAIHTNNIDSITSSNINTLTNYRVHNNSLSLASIDNFYRNSALYFSENTPVRNITVSTEGILNSPPTCGAYNPDVLRLQQIYDSTAYTYTNTVASGGVGDLQQLPLMTLPDTIYILTDEEFEIYDDAITGQVIKENAINIEYTCDIGNKSFYGYLFNQVAGDIGYHTFKAVAKECNTKVDSASCIISVIAGGNGTGTKTFNIIGNSLVYLSPITYVSALRTGLTGITAEMYGTVGESPNKHEGQPGWGFSSFLTRLPMYTGGSYNYTLYRTDTLSLETPFDFTIIQLGINDIVSNITDTAIIDTVIIKNIEILIDGIIADGTGNIIIAMPPKCENTGVGWESNYGDTFSQNYYIHKMQYLWDTICGAFSGERYADNVYVSPQGLFVDRNNGYPKNIYGYHTNGLHPDASGYGQLSNSLRALIEGILKKEE